MGTIVTFPRERREPVETFSFVNDGETLDFDGGETGIQLDGAVPERDWTNQELADLYRVKHLLDQAGLESETDRGLSDEGDPWFVFMREEEVFIHFCRIGDMYHLDSPNLQGALKGRDARALVADYTRKVMHRGDGGHDPKTVVPLRAGGNQVSLHPAVMLAALVWSLLIGAEEGIALPVPGRADAPEPMKADAPLLAAPATSRDTAQTAVSDEAAPNTPTLAAPAEAPSSRDSSGGSNGYAMALSTLAIGIGLLADRGLDLIDDPSLEQILQSLSGLERVAGVSAGETDHAVPSSMAGIEALDILVKITQMPAGPDMLVEREAVAPDGAQEVEEFLVPIAEVLKVTADGAEPPLSQTGTGRGPDIVPITSEPVSAPRETASPQSPDRASDAPAAAAKASPAPTPVPQAPVQAQAQAATPSQAPETQFLKIVSATPSQGPGLAQDESKAGESLLLANFEVTQSLLEKFDVKDMLSAGTGERTGAAPSAPVLVEGEDPEAEAAFDLSRALEEMGDGAARDLIELLVGRQAELEIADSGNWLWIVETDARDAPLGETVSKVFFTDDGAQIMITGLQTSLVDADADIGVGIG